MSTGRFIFLSLALAFFSLSGCAPVEKAVRPPAQNTASEEPAPSPEPAPSSESVSSPESVSSLEPTPAPPAGTVSPAAEHLDQGRTLVEEAKKLRLDRSRNPMMGGVFPSPVDSERYESIYAAARKHFQAIVEEHPRSEYAPEALFMLGLIEDHPHLNNFTAALEAYRRTIEMHPGTWAAVKARRRIETLEGMAEGLEGTPHEGR